MSRSYKKTPRSGDSKHKFFKTYANRVFRHDKLNDLQYNNYKKCYCQWNICDFETVGYAFEDWWNDTLQEWYSKGKYQGKPYPSREDEYKLWYKYYKQK